MSHVFITGSADGLGQMAARLLVPQGHWVVLHGRNRERADEALDAVPGAEAAVAGDLSSMAETREVAVQVNRFGHFDAVIHNASVGIVNSGESKRWTACQTCSRSIRLHRTF